MSREPFTSSEYIHEESLGQMKISDAVMAVCAVNATLKVDGVAGFAAGGLTDSITENILGKESLSKGVKVNQTDDGVVVDIFLIVEYGVKIPEVAWNVQTNVKKELETMTDRPVSKVHIHIQGVVPAKEEESIREERLHD